VAGVATLLSARPILAVVGLYQQGTGLIFVSAIAGSWALGTALGPPDRRILMTSVIVGASVNAVVAVAQVTIGLQNVGLPLYSNGSADALLPNPVYLGALLAAALVLVLPRFEERPGELWPVVGLLGVGVGVSGARMAALLVVAIGVWEIWAVWRTGRRRIRLGERRWTRAGAFVSLGIGGVAGGSLLAWIRGSTGVASQAVSSTADETFGQRLSTWSTGLHEIVHRPWFGAGPGQFRAATSSLFSLSFERQNNGVSFSDAHNLVIEYAVTTGLIGVALLLAWLGLSVWRGRGPLLGFAVVLFVTGLIEPLNPVTTPLMFLALGAAGLSRPEVNERRPEVDPDGRPEEEPLGIPTGPLPRGLAWASVGVAAVATAGGLVFLIGDAALQRSYTEYSVAQDAAAATAGSTANDLLAPWPEPASQIGLIHQYLALDIRHPSQKLTAIDWMRVAAHRDPTDWTLWTNLAEGQAVAGHLDAAEVSSRTALHSFPYFVPALTLLGSLAEAQHEDTAARAWFGRALAVNPTNSRLRALYDGRCHPELPGGHGFNLRPSCHA